MTTSDARPSPGQAASLGQIFNGFLRASLNAFGGGLNVHLLNLVHRQHWLPEAEFAELSTFAQTLPGSNNGNLSALLGYRLAGVPGAAAALCGLLLPGSLLMCVVAWGGMAALLGFFLPPSAPVILAFAFTQRGSPLLTRLYRSLLPVGAGLLLAGLIVLGRGSVGGWASGMIAALSFLLARFSPVPPVLAVVLGLVVGAWLL